MIEWVGGNADLMKERTQALVNPVNCQGVAGAGVALLFKHAFPENHRAYVDECDRNRLLPGRVFVYKTSSGDPMYIFNAATKNYWRYRSNKGWITNCLWEVRKKAEELLVRDVSLPMLGCGNGGVKSEWFVEEANTVLGNDPYIRYRVILR